jgi:cysteinyl-tRNA synthetase
MVSVAQEKMSKSLGNFLTVQEAAGRVGGEAVRLFTLGTHYRSPLDFTDERLEDAAKGLARIYETLARADDAVGQTVADADPGVEKQFIEAMDDDLNTARAIGIVFETVRAINRELDAARTVTRVAALRHAVADIAGVLGIAGQPPADYLSRKRDEHLETSALSPAQIEALIAERAEARAQRNFKRADEIRQELKAKGILLEDAPAGTTWRVER